MGLRERGDGDGRTLYDSRLLLNDDASVDDCGEASVQKLKECVSDHGRGQMDRQEELTVRERTKGHSNSGYKSAGK